MSAADSPSSAVMTTVNLRAAHDPAFADWQAAFTRAAAAAPGFVSLEVVPAFASGMEWRIIQRFQTPRLLETWRNCNARAQLLADLTQIRVQNDNAPLDEVAPDFNSLSCVTEVITTVVEPGRGAEFQAWAEGMQAKQAAFPGYKGTLIQAPLSPDIPYWTTLVRFAKPEQLEAWLNSPDRKAVLERADPHVSKWKSQRLPSPFAGWFPTAPDQAPPARWKTSMIVLLVLYPVIMLEIRYLSPLLTGLHIASATFIGNVISVAVTAWPLTPWAMVGLGWWLQPKRANRRRTGILGAATVTALYAIEILIFLYWQ